MGCLAATGSLAQLDLPRSSSAEYAKELVP